MKIVIHIIFTYLFTAVVIFVILAVFLKGDIKTLQAPVLNDTIGLSLPCTEDEEKVNDYGDLFTCFEDKWIYIMTIKGPV